jgi:NADPH-dependent ferric siderophore reductase
MTSVTATVVEASRLSAHFQRVVFHVSDLGEHALLARPDASLGIYFGESASSPGRTYTVRDYDSTTGAITVDILLHGVGVGTDWVRRTAGGDGIVIAHPGAWYAPSADAGPQLLVADMAGLPALARIIEALPPGIGASAIVELLDENDLDYLPQRSGVEVIASIGTGNGIGASALADLVRRQSATDTWGYCWFGGEAAEARAIRKFLRRELCWDVRQFDVMGYWRMHSEDWDRRHAAVGADLFAAYQKAVTEGTDERVAAEEYDLALERAGL